MSDTSGNKKAQPDLINKSLSAYYNVALQKLCLIAKSASRGMPSVLYFEPASGCNLACPACPTGIETGGRPAQLTDFDRFREAVDLLGPKLFLLYMYNWGEPLLNKRVSDYISYATEADIYTSISSNLSIKLSDARMASLLEAGLGELKVGLDGWTQPVYQKYRRNGDVELVKDNLRRFAAIKQNRPELNTNIYVQFHVFRHNLHEVQTVKQFCRELGIGFGVSGVVYTAEEEGIYSATPDHDAGLHSWKQLKKQANYEKGCSWLTHALVIEPSLDVAPCCGVSDAKDNFAKLNQDTFSNFCKAPYSHSGWVAAKSFLD